VSKPHLKTYANLWTLWDHPSSGEMEWSLERKVAGIAAAGFDGVMGDLGTGVGAVARGHGLAYIAFSRLDGDSDFEKAMLAAREEGAVVLQVHLGWHDTGVDEALRWALALHEASGRLGLEVVIETHRDTCTETPEKTKELRRRFHAETGGTEIPLLPDFSHPAVVKHLMPPWAPRLLDDEGLVRRSRWHHLRPFNGHHAQVPVLAADRRTLTIEAEEWMLFVRALFALLREGSLPEIWVCPEIGPLRSGYGLSCFAPAWDEALALRSRLIAEWEER
jgi:hypothetical protein